MDPGRMIWFLSAISIPSLGIPRRTQLARPSRLAFPGGDDWLIARGGQSLGEPEFKGDSTLDKETPQSRSQLGRL